MKKALSLILALVMCLSLCACGGVPQGSTIGNVEEPTTTQHTHDWKAATCTKAKTCLICGETEGNVADHDWKAATCTDPQICKSCGKTEGTVIEHNYKDGKCTLCGIEDPAVEQISNAKAAYTMLQVAEGYCDLFSSMISKAWYFAIYKSDNYYSGDSAIAAFSSYVGIEKDLVTAGVDSYLTAIGYSIDSTSRCAVLRTNSGALYVVDYALSKNDGFKNAKDCLNAAQEYIRQLDVNYASVNARTELVALYSAVSAYYDFCYSPSGSYSTLSSTLNGFRTNCANNRTLCGLYLD